MITATAPTTSIEITNPRQRLAFIPQLFYTPKGDQLVANFLHAHSNYDGGLWRYFEVPRGICGQIASGTEIAITRPTGYLVPPEGMYHLQIPGNYFDEEVSADAAGIIATLFALNRLSWEVSEMESLDHVCQGLVDRQYALKDYVSIINHPESRQIFWAFD